MDKRYKLSGIFRSSQVAPWSDLNGFEQVVEMITLYRKVRGDIAAGTALCLRWASAVNIKPLRLVKRIKEDEILDSELSEMEEQEGAGRKGLTDSRYVALHITNQLKLLKDPPKHIANSRVYNEIFDLIHNSYLSLYNDSYSMSSKGWMSKKNALHIIGKNYYLDSTLYPNMINLMVKSGYDNMLKKISNDKNLRDLLLDGVKDEGLTYDLIDSYGSEDEMLIRNGDYTIEDYDKAVSP